MGLKIFISPLREGHWVVKTRGEACQLSAHFYSACVQSGNLSLRENCGQRKSLGGHQKEDLVTEFPHHVSRMWPVFQGNNFCFGVCLFFKAN